MQTAQRYNRSQLLKLADRMLDRLDNKGIYVIMTSPFIMYSHPTLEEEYRHMQSFVDECIATTSQCLELPYVTMIVAYFVWSDKLRWPMLISVQQMEPKAYNKLVKDYNVR